VTQSAEVMRKRDSFHRAIFMHYAYSLKCKDGFYVDCTNDLKDRFMRHQKGNIPDNGDKYVKLAISLV